MTPDKIYAGYRYENNNEDLYARKTPLTNRDIEYIRKDIVDKTIELAEDHAMLAGMNMMEQQMMEKAVEKYVHELYTDEEGYHCYISLGTEYAPGDKVRVIVVKED